LVEEKTPPPLTPTEKDFVAAGKETFNTICAACHLPEGQGQEGLAPPLADSEWVVGPEVRLVRIVLQGLGGPVTVNGNSYSLDMPGLGAALTDQQIAQVLSYVRRNFGNVAPVVQTGKVTEIRAATVNHDPNWTADELLRFE
jgi:mono/diheme cytochrome c family protein